MSTKKTLSALPESSETDRVTVTETALTPEILSILIRMSADWEAEGSCHGYRKNEKEDIDGNRIFLAEKDGRIIGYLFGHMAQSKQARSIMPDGTPIFEIEELYVEPAFRSCGIGKQLFSFAEQAVSGDASFLMLSTATKNWKSILHFYLEEAGMEFWSARLYKKV